ncbi:MAG: zinc ribbon domain-containing protein [Planctomycetota bacterium]|jgi:hypothetical protein
MPFEQIECPSCGTVLDVPAGSAGRFARCGGCQHRFQIPDPGVITDDEIASLLTDQTDEIDLDEEMLVPDDVEDPSQRSTIMAAEALATTGGIRLIEATGESVVFEYPAAQMHDVSFRCALPRECIRCGARIHLKAHVVPMVSSLSDRHVVDSMLASGKLRCSSPNAASMSNDDLLAALPDVLDVPPPANLPIPFWLCDMCEPEPLIYGQVIEDARTGNCTCRLTFENPHRARQFVRALHDVDPAIAQRLEDLCEAKQENPWDLVPATIRHRLQQWFRPDPKERFIEYIPDRDRSRTEDGMTGLVVSDKRLVCHTQMRRRETPKGEPLELELAMTREQGKLRIKTPGWQVQRFTIDREGARLLRRALTAGGFHASWR